MRRRDGFVLIAGLTALAASAAITSGALAAEKVTWNISIWGNPRALTAGLEAVRDYAAEKSGGNLEIKIAYGETLSPAKENIDAVKIGVVEGAQFCSSYGPGKTPIWTVLDLPFLPTPNTAATIAVHEAFYKNESALEELARWNAMPFMTPASPRYELMGVGPAPKEISDWKGMRVRAVGGQGEAMRRLGAVPTNVTAPEIYTGLERGMFEAAAFPFSYAFASFKLDEISKWYTINMNLGVLGCHFIIGRAAWTDLPEEYRQILTEAKAVAYEVHEKTFADADKENIPAFDARGLTRITYTPEQLAHLHEVAGRPVWDAWVEDMEAKGLPGRAVLDYVIEAGRAAGG